MYLGRSKNAIAIDYKDPFKADKVSNINLIIGKGMFDEEVRFRGVIEFKNGNTSGKQRIEEKDFNSLVLKTEEFIKNL